MTPHASVLCMHPLAATWPDATLLKCKMLPLTCFHLHVVLLLTGMRQSVKGSSRWGVQKKMSLLEGLYKAYKGVVYIEPQVVYQVDNAYGRLPTWPPPISLGTLSLPSS